MGINVNFQIGVSSCTCPMSDFSSLIDFSQPTKNGNKVKKMPYCATYLKGLLLVFWKFSTSRIVEKFSIVIYFSAIMIIELKLVLISKNLEKIKKKGPLQVQLGN